MLAGFPPKFEAIRTLYADFRPRFEFHRESFSAWWKNYLQRVSLDDFQQQINTDTELAREVRQQLVQRHFYRSATSFYRAFDLFLGFLALQKQRFGTWAEVTGYYSRFYFIQALLNLLQSSWFGAEESIPKDGLINARDCRFFAYNTGDRFVFLREAQLLTELGTNRLGSHAIWWKLYNCLEHVDDFPQIESLEFVLGDGYFNVEQRNKVNYSHEYIEGFPELEWFDVDVRNMMSHFAFHPIRHDRDITDIDRFFSEEDPETADEGDYYGDEAQMLWCSIACYLRVLRALQIDQDFISKEKLGALSETHLQSILPKLCNGIITGIGEIFA